MAIELVVVDAVGGKVVVAVAWSAELTASAATVVVLTVTVEDDRVESSSTTGVVVLVVEAIEVSDKDVLLSLLILFKVEFVGFDVVATTSESGFSSII